MDWERGVVDTEKVDEPGSSIYDVLEGFSAVSR